MRPTNGAPAATTLLQVAKGVHFTYCERVYLNPATGTGPLWADLLPARLSRLRLPADSAASAALFARIRLPSPAAVEVFGPEEPLRFLHIIKTGGESLERYLSRPGPPALSFDTCRTAALASGKPTNTSAPSSCLAAATVVSTALCGLVSVRCTADASGNSGSAPRHSKSYSLSPERGGSVGAGGAAEL